MLPRCPRVGRRVEGGPPGDRGSAVVEFSLVSVLLLTLLLGIAQVAVYLHIRNVVTASAAEGARWAANADVPTAEGGPRAQELLGRALGSGTAGRLSCVAEEQAGAGGATLVRVRCAGAVPVFFAPLGDLLPVDVEAWALEESP